MGSKNRRRHKEGFYTDSYWQSASYNQRAFVKNLDMLLAIAINRFRWVGMPDTCDARFFEKALHRNGIATIAHKSDDETPVFVSLMAAPFGTFNMYGLPTKWQAIGFDGYSHFDCNDENGELCYYSYARVSPWNALEIYARKMAHYERTEDVNLTQQMKPFIGIAPQEKKLELVNILKQLEGGEPAILGDDGLSSLVDKVKVLDLNVDLITEEMEKGYQNILARALLYLGVPHLAFEKGERMIEREAMANTAPTEIMLLDCLNARREFCEKINRKFGLELEVYFNTDWESYNFNYTNNIEQMAQDKLILSKDETFTGLNGVIENDTTD